jgi:hypothetical protein
LTLGTRRVRAFSGRRLGGRDAVFVRIGKNLGSATFDRGKAAKSSAVYLWIKQNGTGS